MATDPQLLALALQALNPQAAARPVTPSGNTSSAGLLALYQQMMNAGAAGGAPSGAPLLPNARFNPNLPQQATTPPPLANPAWNPNASQAPAALRPMVGGGY